MKNNIIKKALAVILSSAVVITTLPQENLITASAAKKNVSLNTTFKTLKIGKSYKLKLKNNTINWKIKKVTTSNKKICTVYNKKSTTVLLKGKNEGRATIKIKIKTNKRKVYNKKTLKCRVKVIPGKSSQTPIPDQPTVSEPESTYNIEFNTNGGNIISGQTVTGGNTITKPADPTKSGYIFKGWYSDISLQNAYDFTSIVTDNMTLYAKWNNTYKVEFQTNGGNKIEDQIIENGGIVSKPADPTRARSTFIGWFSDSQLKEPYDFSSAVTKDITIYARWEGGYEYPPNLGYTGGNNTSNDTENDHVTTVKYTVKFDSNGGSLVSDQTVKNNEYVIEPTNPTKEGYIFDGWYIDKDLTMVYDFETSINKDIILYAKWNAVLQTKCTIKFNTNGGSIVEEQIVEKGGLAKQPDAPTRSGYTFEGWYTAVSDGQKFDFSTTITENITLYAKWTDETADDLTDVDSTEVTADDKYILSASEREVVAESHTNVVFYVNSTLTVSNFELLCNGISTGVLLYDDGDFDGHHDDIPNDGCYTGVYTINMAVEGDVEFSARATVGTTPVTTNVKSVFVYYELTDAELDEMEEIDATIQNIIAETQSENEGKDKATMISSLRTNIIAYLESLIVSGVVERYSDESDEAIDYYSISFRLRSGISDGVVYYSSNENSSPTVEDGICADATSEDIGRNKDSTNAWISSGDISTTSTDIDVNYATYKESALLLCYEAFSSGWNGASLEDTTANLNDFFTNAGFVVDNRYSVTVDDFKNMQNHAYIHVACHGSYYTLWTSPFTNAKTPVICTPQRATKQNKKDYSADIKKDRIVIVGGEYFIRPSFFEFYYGDDPLKAKVVSLGCCKGAYTDALANSLVGVGASSVLAYSDTVYTAYDYHMSAKIADELCRGKTVSVALSEGKSVYGNTDLIWGAAQRDGGNTNFNTLKAENAELKCYGSASQTIHSELLNGNFDSLLNLLTTKPSSWKIYGDSRTIFKLSGIRPISSPKMAVISSGFGSLNDETTSAIYQTFLVPEGATTLSFSYDVVSEEPMEFVGTKFDDIFKVEILNTKGDVLEDLVNESVNTSTWYPVEGINFPDGDETTYHTRWKDFSSDVISKYQGQLIALRFIVYDSGDAIYDTAALIDSVAIN